MRRIIGLVLVGLGAGTIALAIALPTYVYPRVAKVPADPDRSLTYVGTGVSAFLIRGTDEGGPRAVTDVNLTAQRYVTADVRPGAPAPGPDDVLWRNSFRADAEGYGLLTAYVEGISFDNRTGEATNCCDDYVRNDAIDPRGEKIKHEGLLLKFPFATQKRDYDFWDLNLKRAMPARYVGEDTLYGLDVYKFQQDIPAEVTQQQDVPASVFGLTTPGNVKADDVYENKRTIWVEPETGSVIKGSESQNRRLVAEGREVPALVGTITNTEQNVRDAVDEYGPLGSQLHLVRVTGPVAGWIVGPLLVLVGLVLLIAGRRRDDQDGDEDTFEPVLGSPVSPRPVGPGRQTPTVTDAPAVAPAAAPAKARPVQRPPKRPQSPSRPQGSPPPAGTKLESEPRPARPARRPSRPASATATAEVATSGAEAAPPRRPARPASREPRTEVLPQDRLRPRQDTPADDEPVTRPAPAAARPKAPLSRPPRRPGPGGKNAG